jgi:Holliday junction DNA helicase RuvB
VHATSGPALSRPTDLVATLHRVQHGDVLFIDEIHRLPVTVEEFIYSAMEDFRIDICLDSGLNARTVQIPLKPFTLIGATTRAGLLSSPLRSRFGIVHSPALLRRRRAAHDPPSQLQPSEHRLRQ